MSPIPPLLVVVPLLVAAGIAAVSSLIPRRVADGAVAARSKVPGSQLMMRIAVCALFALGLFVGVGAADDKPVKNQMVKGTVKSVNVKDGVLVVNQKVKNEIVERQLDIKSSTEFVITINGEKKEVNGKEGLELLVEGASVTVKCDKDVNVLKVTATIKK